MTRQDFRAYARQLSGQTINERIDELERATIRDQRNAAVYIQQVQLLRDELERRTRDYSQLDQRMRVGVGTRPTTLAQDMNHD
jgi:hypothetical protein